MWAEKEIGDSMTSGLEHIAHAIPYEVKKDLSLIKHKLDGLDSRLVFDWHWIVGCCIALFAAVSSNLGLNLQRLSHLENQFYDPFAKVKRERPKSEQSSMFLRPRWVMGISLMIVASVADFAALSFAAQSLVASLGSLSLVANALIAPMIVREKITAREWKAIALICMGDSACILFGQHKSEVYTLEGLMSLYGLPAFAVYAVVTAVAVVGIWCSIYWIETVYAPERAGDANSASADSIDSIDSIGSVGSVQGCSSSGGGGGGTGGGAAMGGGTSSAAAAAATTTTEAAAATAAAADGAATTETAAAAAAAATNTANTGDAASAGSAPHEYSFTYDPRGCIAKYHRFSHAMLSGILGAQSVLLGKSTAELIKTAIAGRGNLFTHFGTYAILVCMFSCIFLQVHYLNEALKRVEATIVVPVFQTFWTLVSVVGGFVFYKEYRDLQMLQIAMFGVGLVLILIGVHMMSQRGEGDGDGGGGGDDNGHRGRGKKGRRGRGGKKLTDEEKERRRRRRRRRKANKKSKNKERGGVGEDKAVMTAQDKAVAAMADALLLGQDGAGGGAAEPSADSTTGGTQNEEGLSGQRRDNHKHAAAASDDDQMNAEAAVSAATGGSADPRSSPSSSSSLVTSSSGAFAAAGGTSATRTNLEAGLGGTVALSSPRSDRSSNMGSPGTAAGARVLNMSGGGSGGGGCGYSESETGTDMPYSESDMDDSFSEHDTLLGGGGGGGGGGLLYTPVRRQRQQQTHSHLASACSLPGMLIDSAARSVVRRNRLDRSAAASASVGGRSGARGARAGKGEQEKEERAAARAAHGGLPRRAGGLQARDGANAYMGNDCV